MQVAIAFYSSTIFVQGGSTIEQALFASLGFGESCSGRICMQLINKGL
jgi:hypothetical protein